MMEDYEIDLVYYIDISIRFGIQFFDYIMIVFYSVVFLIVDVELGYVDWS